MVCVQVHFIAYEFPSTLSLFVKKTILIVLSFLFVNYFGCSLQTIMLSLKIALFSPSLSVCLIFIFLPYFISQNFQYDVEKEWQGDILAVCLILLGSFTFLIIKYDISYKFCVDILFPVEEVTLCSQFTVMNGCFSVVFQSKNLLLTHIKPILGSNFSSVQHTQGLFLFLWNLKLNKYYDNNYTEGKEHEELIAS